MPTLDNDGCSMGFDSSSPSADVSPYSKTGKSFTCGAIAAGLIACQKEKATGNVLCLQSLERRMAVRFPSNVSKIRPRDPGERPTPLQVKLANGATCSAASHDQTTHYQDRRSWLYCDSAGDAVLLLPKDFDPTKGAGQKYFDKTNATWTAQYSVNNMAPKTVAVTKVVYAP